MTETSQPSDHSSSLRVRKPSRRAIAAFSEKYALIGAWIIVIIFFGIKEPSTFLTTANFSTIFGSQAVLVVLTLALLIPLTAGDYDLSVAAMLSLSAMELAILNVNHHWSIEAAIAVSLATGLLVGFINGCIIVVFQIDPFIVTLGTGTIISGIVFWISGSNTISGVSSGLVNDVIVTQWFGIPLEFYYGLILCAIMWYVLEFTPVGRRLLFVGRGRNVSRLSGLSVGRMRWGAMMTSGFIAALAGALYAGTTGAADPTSGDSFLLPAFAAAFLGATSIIPGRFNPWGSFIAVYFLVTGITGLQLMGVQSFVQQLFYGGSLVLAVILSQIARGRRVATLE